MESTATLLSLVREGDEKAKSRLFERYLPLLVRWASGRLPPATRSLADTNDLVQVTLLKALNKVDGFQPRHEGAFLYYLRRALVNQIRDLIRHAKRQPEMRSLSEDIPDQGATPHGDALRGEIMDRYDAALETLTPAQREAVVLRLELGLTHVQVAEALEDCPSADAARMLVTRGILRLAKEMGPDLNPDGSTR